MGLTRPHIRRTQSAPDVMSLLAGGLAAMAGGGGGRRRRGASLPPDGLSVADAARASQAADWESQQLPAPTAQAGAPTAGTPPTS